MRIRVRRLSRFALIVLNTRSGVRFQSIQRSDLYGGAAIPRVYYQNARLDR